jgi:hypothetical protein
MASQKGIIKLAGTIGNITFYKTQDGYLAKEKTSLDATRIATDPNFVRTRENGVEFGHAAKVASTLRLAFRSVIQNNRDNRMVSRLTQRMIAVVYADETSIRGQRNVMDGETELMEGFQFNIKAPLSSTLNAPYTASIDRVTGICRVDIPIFIPTNMITASQGATHFKLTAGASAIDFESKIFMTDARESAMLPFTNAPTPLIDLSCIVYPASVHPIFLIFGIEFYQSVNKEFYPLRNGTNNALCVVKVSGV